MLPAMSKLRNVRNCYLYGLKIFDTGIERNVRKHSNWKEQTYNSKNKRILRKITKMVHQKPTPFKENDSKNQENENE